MSEKYSFEPIGRIHSPYREKFGIPRQPGLVQVPGSIEIFPAWSRAEAFRELETFSHVWVMFVFHQAMRDNWKPMVRPPRLGGNERVGVFASRSMFRPNPIGLSVVELKAVRQQDGQIYLDIIGGDFLDGTPVLDIKPYLPYVDALPAARGGYAEQPPVTKFDIEFSPDVLEQIKTCSDKYPELEHIIRNILQFDPRPAYQEKKPSTKEDYAMRLYEFDVKWRIEDNHLNVYALY